MSVCYLGIFPELIFINSYAPNDEGKKYDLELIGTLNVLSKLIDALVFGKLFVHMVF